MDGLLKFIRALHINSAGAVVAWTLAATVFTVAVPVGVLYFFLGTIEGLSPSAFRSSLWMAALIPLLMVPPIAFIVLSLVRMLAGMIERLDVHVKIDPMTRLMSRNYFLTEMGLSTKPGALLMVDADHFKRINDNFGHDMGDIALCAIASAIAHTAGGGSLVGRLGGEEFAVFVPGAGRRVAEITALRICESVRSRRPQALPAEIALSVSIGIAFHEPRTSVSVALKHADKLLYQAKRSGRDRFCMDLAPETPEHGIDRSGTARQAA